MATAIQVEYWKNQEIKRHNQAAESQAAKELAETARHNYRTEGQTDVSQQEVARHNRTQESLGFGQLAETTRHNTVQESNDAQRNQEAIRHNKATESNDAQRNLETIRHNKMTESLTGQQLAQLITEQDRRYGLDAGGTVKFKIGGQTYTLPAETAAEVLQQSGDDVARYTKKGAEWVVDKGKDVGPKLKSKARKSWDIAKHGRPVEIVNGEPRVVYEDGHVSKNWTGH